MNVFISSNTEERSVDISPNSKYFIAVNCLYRWKLLHYFDSTSCIFLPAR